SLSRLHSSPAHSSMGNDLHASVQTLARPRRGRIGVSDRWDSSGGAARGNYLICCPASAGFTLRWLQQPPPVNRLSLLPSPGGFSRGEEASARGVTLTLGTLGGGLAWG